MTYVVLVCGSRDWTDQETMTDAIVRHQPSEIIHGSARGADTLAKEIAEMMGYPCRAFPADWNTYGKRAGILRNIRMLDERPDLVLAFQRNGSRGTQHTINEARRRGIPVEIHTA